MEHEKTQRKLYLEEHKITLMINFFFATPENMTVSNYEANQYSCLI
jgi:hypothetical protein